VLNRKPRKGTASCRQQFLINDEEARLRHSRKRAEKAIDWNDEQGEVVPGS
jgi:hypothetical protein